MSDRYYAYETRQHCDRVLEWLNKLALDRWDVTTMPSGAQPVWAQLSSQRTDQGRRSSSDDLVGAEVEQDTRRGAVEDASMCVSAARLDEAGLVSTRLRFKRSTRPCRLDEMAAETVTSRAFRPARVHVRLGWSLFESVASLHGPVDNEKGQGCPLKTAKNMLALGI
ncbi:unnamed protein product [Protopolystoma xenopodis]|uniref:Uncharacterized protein n=1 Tax=Protopolystoma xenopodis TaxID=117903 RepID=A0A448XC40_9PLAT|nr:unnamed protein product [Protopolystoma xenopodis]